jgi:hypothetical protein
MLTFININFLVLFFDVKHSFANNSISYACDICPHWELLCGAQTCLFLRMTRFLPLEERGWIPDTVVPSAHETTIFMSIYLSLVANICKRSRDKGKM